MDDYILKRYFGEEFYEIAQILKNIREEKFLAF
jgi:hypothetical protein